VLAAALLAVVGCGPAAEGPEGIDLSYNPEQYQPYHPETAEYAIGMYSYPNGWVRLWLATPIRGDVDAARQLALKEARRLFERAAEIARERNQDYAALLDARTIRIDLVTKDRLGFERSRVPEKFASDILVAFRATPGRGWVKASDFAAFARK
jgi:hypothetical protein